MHADKVWRCDGCVCVCASVSFQCMLVIVTHRSCDWNPLRSVRLASIRCASEFCEHFDCYRPTAASSSCFPIRVLLLCSLCRDSVDGGGDGNCCFCSCSCHCHCNRQPASKPLRSCFVRKTQTFVPNSMISSKMAIKCHCNRSIDSFSAQIRNSNHY